MSAIAGKGWPAVRHPFFFPGFRDARERDLLCAESIDFTSDLRRDAARSPFGGCACSDLSTKWTDSSIQFPRSAKPKILDHRGGDLRRSSKTHAAHVQAELREDGDDVTLLLVGIEDDVTARRDKIGVAAIVFNTRPALRDLSAAQRHGAALLDDVAHRAIPSLRWGDVDSQIRSELNSARGLYDRRRAF